MNDGRLTNATKTLFPMYVMTAQQIMRFLNLYFGYLWSFGFQWKMLKIPINFGSFPTHMRRSVDEYGETLIRFPCTSWLPNKSWETTPMVIRFSVIAHKVCGPGGSSLRIFDTRTFVWIRLWQSSPSQLNFASNFSCGD